MTLDNFFTLNELENGLTAPNRVNELITVMQSEKDLVVNSFGQTTRQWSTVATTIAATENKNCLDLFIQLNGLFFINKWLKDSQNPRNDEYIICFLRALEKLQIDDDKHQFVISSGIMKTLEDLVANNDNNNHTVREKAKELCDNWKLIQDKNKTPQEATNNDPVECRPPDYGMDSETKNQEPLDYVANIKSTDDYDDHEDPSSKSEGVSKSDVKNENKITSDAEYGEIPKMSLNSDDENEAHDTNVSVQSNGNSENGMWFFKLSINNKNLDMEINNRTIDRLDIEAERETDSRERSCSTFEKTPDSNNGQESQSQSQHVNAETHVSQISEVAHESEPDARNPFSLFDLNQEVCSEEIDNLENRTHKNPNRHLGFHDFDLNVAEDGEEGKIVISPSGEESLVANPSKPERLQWDLNSIDDTSSSSSVSKQPIILRNIDLNLNDQTIGDDQFISILGVRVEVNKRNDDIPQVEPKFDFSYGHHNSMFFSMPQVMNMVAAGVTAGASGLEPPLAPPQYNFDLNTGLVVNDGLRQFFPQNVNEQGSSSSVLGKRGAPDSDRQVFPVSKRQQPS